MPRLVTACLAAALLLVACEPPSSPSAPPASPDPASPQGLLSALHLAATEMALDGFQFDKPDLGWPADVSAGDSRAYIALLRENQYLADPGPRAVSDVTVANTSETDPLETALFHITARNGSVTIIRKDGKIDTFPDLASSAAFAPPPPREPRWLP